MALQLILELDCHIPDLGQYNALERYLKKLQTPGESFKVQLPDDLGHAVKRVLLKSYQLTIAPEDPDKGGVGKL